jgi:hypothetical protein
MTARAWVLVGIFFIGVQMLALKLMGQPPICECGYIKLWEGVVLSSGNSQHLTDWYTPSHVIHGILFYLGLWFFFPRMPIAIRLALAVGIEVSWEIFENTPWIINRYREQALAQGYIGDSVINSVFDTLAMVGGFLIAWRAPIWLSVVLVIALEMFVLYSIRDSLTLNVVQLLYPIEVISNWQAGS